MFGRRRKKKAKSRVDDIIPPAVAPRPTPMAEPVKEDDKYRAQGPWDVSEEVPEARRVDLGSLRVPVGPDIEVQVNVARQQNQNRVIGVTIINGRTALQVQPFAAPKSTGLWTEIRQEIVAEIAKSGGKSEEFEGTFGPEIRAIVPVPGKTNEKGQRLAQPMRFIGVDGPRWFLRGVIRGEGAVRPEAAARIEEIFAGIVVVRGHHPVPPRDLLELRLPNQSRPAPGQVAVPKPGTQNPPQ
ncbi:DUF3710 domain-containing protein [Thermobifida fusca]|uniref:DUF3710 domain-containing protein n=2 Tax=Thermobifida fusca TaxID=2021 RepID=A0A9P2WQY0_THEFU|nr:MULTISPECIES: DUF3710 domain-containing protein [Thermobifida]AAZ55967.1 conserved hypothetical protein [Thermobifida fusca YX]EOR71013.1 hypothetical protein TM51_09961 [Thermobifida fusca TM51]MBO2528384.1 DUF3710 domain-containing protein [Thermobifida sp.]MDD6791652.1 DUF3710 domain-containing protein [Thermobifida fusca]PPS91965.1 hypothetical protein BH05_12500 [Thermobifida fusca]